MSDLCLLPARAAAEHRHAGVGKILPAGFVCRKECLLRRRLALLKVSSLIFSGQSGHWIRHGQYPSDLFVSSIPRYHAKEELIDIAS